DVPAAFYKGASEKIEQLWMTRAFTLSSEIIRRFYQADPKEFLPDPVHRNACRQGMLGMHEPLREAKSIARGIMGKGIEKGGEGWRHLVAQLFVLAAQENVGFRCLRLIGHHQGRRGHGLDPTQICLEVC